MEWCPRTFMPFSKSVFRNYVRGLAVPGPRIMLIGVFSIAAMGWLAYQHLWSDGYLPHAYCFGGETRLVWTNATADTLIGASYLGISALLMWIARKTRNKLPFAKLFWLFGLFIVSCGVAHVLEMITLWRAVYWLSTAAKIATAIVSVSTVVLLIYFAREIVRLVMEKADVAEIRGNQRFRAVVQATPLAVIAANCEGQVTSWNPSAEKYLDSRKRIF